MGSGEAALTAAVRASDLSLGYDRHPAVHHLSGSFDHGTLTAVVGPNGSGKSTLLKGVMGLVEPLGGAIEIRGIRRGAAAYLPQQAEVDRSFPISVLETVLFGFWQAAGLFGRIDRAMLRTAERALDAVGLSGFAGRPIASLSAGQFQRVLFARMLVQDSPLILLDEPFTAIDARTTADLIAVVERWHGEARTVIAVLHDIEQVKAHFPQTLLLAREPVAWGPTAEVLQPANLLRARRMAEAWDDRAEVCRRSGR